MGALRALLPACALVKSRGRRGQPSNLPGAGAPPRCSARGGAHQVNAARKALAMLLTPTRPWLSNEGGASHTHVPVSHDPAGKKRKMQGISRTRPHSPLGGRGDGRYLGKVCLQTIVSGLTFRSLIHFEFIFVYGVRKCSSFILLQVVDQISQHLLLLHIKGNY